MIRPRHRAALLALAALLLSSAPGRARAEELRYPETEPGRHAREFFAAYNGTEAGMRAFWESNGSKEALATRPVELRLGVWRDMRSEHGTLTPLAIKAAGDDFTEVLARAATGGSLRIRFMCEAAAPHGLVALRVEAGEAEQGTPPEPAGPPPTDAEIVAALSAECDSLAAAGAFSGAVLLEKDGKPLFQKAYGMASRRDRMPNTPETRFNVGSINKMFTTVAIHQLAQAHRLDLDSTVDRYLPDYPRANASRITVRQLLSHRGGVPDVFGRRYHEMDPSKLRTAADWYALVRDEPLEFEPGTSQAYSNGGYALLGMIVQRVSGEDYYDYIRKHVYAPAGMKKSDHYAKDERVEGRAIGYTTRPEGGPPGAESASREAVENTPGLPGRGSAAGGGYSTVGDLVRFSHALSGGKLLDADGTQRVYGGGLGIAGGSPGVNALLETAGPWMLAVLANQDPPAAERFAKSTGRMMRRAANPGGTDSHETIRVGGGHH